MACVSITPRSSSSEFGLELYQPMMQRYFADPNVSQWLLSRDPHPLLHSSTLNTAFSYACMYYASSRPPSGPGPYPLPKPFLDIGDFVVFHRRCGYFALGSLYNPNEKHSMANIRDMVLTSQKLSSRPRARNFAVDLRIKNLELMEFIWMDDDSLIVACRRLHPSSLVPEKPVVLSADFLFYSVLQPGDTLTDPPLLTMSLTERQALCQFCGEIGVDTCRCPPNYKIRVPSVVPSRVLNSLPISYDSLTQSSVTPLYRHEPNTVNNILQCWPINTDRLFKIDQIGMFFCDWHKYSPNQKCLVPTHSFPHPIPYQFVTGSRPETVQLASMFIKNLQVHDRIVSLELRLQHTLHHRQKRIQHEAQQNHLPEEDATATTFDFDIPHIEPEASISFESNPETALDNELDIRLSSGTLSFKNHHSLNIDHLAVASSDANGSPCSDSNVTAAARNECNIQDLLPSLLEESSQEQSPNQSVATVQSSAPRGSAMSADDKDRLEHFLEKNVINKLTCVPCHKSFSKRSNLVRHIQTKHLGLKPFQCESCNRRFGHRNHLIRHMDKLHHVRHFPTS